MFSTVVVRYDQDHHKLEQEHHLGLEGRSSYLVLVLFEVRLSSPPLAFLPFGVLLASFVRSFQSRCMIEHVEMISMSVVVE